ncbi:MAG: sigma-70 family RNA polymerase sigma factor, partial [Sphingobacteriaceae bacterium]
LNIENDLLLLAALKLGDEIAFKNIYNNYWLTLFNSAYSHIKDKEKCQDIIQNVFTDLWNRRTELEIQNLQAFLYTAVRFQALKAIHQNARQTYFVDAFDTKIISSLKTDEVLLEKEAKNIVELFIKALPEKRRHIFLLHYFDELSTADIAGRLNVSQKTVQNQLTTASHALRLRLTQLFSYTFFITSFFIR